MSSQWWSQNGVCYDIFCHLRSKEMHVHSFLFRSTQLPLRRYLVDGIAVICQLKDLSENTLHLAVMLLDVFMDRAPTGPSLKHVALCCIGLSAKYEEGGSGIPLYPELHKYLPIFMFSEPPPSSYLTPLKIEILILSQLRWDVFIPTAAHFLDFFRPVSVCANDFSSDVIPSEAEAAKQCVHKYIKYFTDVSLQDYTLKVHRPSLICAACIACARVCVELSPHWTLTLQTATQYSWQEIEGVVCSLLRVYEHDKARTPCHPSTPTNPLPALNTTTSSYFTKSIIPKSRVNSECMVE
ncbi:hypothetical protein CAPTEDRAFT_149145 [Capitella teleta]|uniref:Cyclin N-terminal domain-containing protein n=1 Tax=Capitella teleta TaxID=283909 RepID=R7TYZ3_CAPTE|nr:hypothetical protein CAPTEDRAFT_149145 [Capitella teleta]|eukprot:ELT96641.1 hypothetical protein CAPTEDRAFT_149145 [Capitella teleta]